MPLNKSAGSVPKHSLKNPVMFLAFGFGSGLLPKAPGTYGTLCAIPIFMFIGLLNPIAYVLIVSILALGGIWICDYAAKKLKVHDHPGIVWDEIVGFLITMVAGNLSIVSILTGFVLFRFFDIVKPWPIGKIDAQVKGGFGIMLDDIIAGFFAAFCLALLTRFIFP